MEIKTTFYTRKYLGNSEYEFKELCQGEIFGKNIWINEPDELPETKDKILNFNYIFNKTYERISNRLVNTHFRYFIHNVGEEPKLSETKLFAKLKFWQRFKLKIIMEETGWQRNPIEFGILTIMLISLCITTLFSYLNWRDSNSDYPEKIYQEVKELKEIIHSKEIKIQNEMVISDSLLKKDTTNSKEILKK